jgi:hypothetical protein
MHMLLPNSHIPTDNRSNSVTEFVDKHIGSFIQWEVIRYFYANPHTADTAAQISRYIQRNVRVTHAELTALTESGLLHKFEFDDLIIYTLTENEDLRQELRKFMEACHDRLPYLRATVQIMKRLRT